MIRSGYDDDLRLAHVIADQVDSLTMARFKALDLRVETKPDTTPVSDADRSAEAMIRSQLARTRPRDAVHGEEMPDTGHGPRQWVVDPIDGTKNFVRGVPVWATLIALLDDGEPVLGVVSAPALGRRWWAAKGSGAWSGRSLSSATRLHVSEVGRLADASLSYSSLSGWEEQGRLEQFLGLAPDGVAHAGLRRLLVPRPGRRGSRRPVVRARARAARHGGARPDRHRGGRAVHVRRAASPVRSAARRWSRTVACTTPRSRPSAPTRTAEQSGPWAPIG